MKIAVIGTGHAGLVAGACFAENGNDVACVDRDEPRLRALRRGKVPVFEPGLEDLVRRNRGEKRLAFTSLVPPAVRAATIVFLAVEARRDEPGDAARLAPVLEAAKDVARAMNGYKVVVVRSDVPVGTADRVREVVRRETIHPFSVVANPGFLQRGTAVEDFMKPDRVVVGAEDPRATQAMTELYAPFTRFGAPILLMDCASAELCKYAATALLATKISFMNEVAHACELCGADVDQVRRAVAADRRIGPAFLFPGVGYGGSGLPGGVEGLRELASSRGQRFQVLDAVSEVNRLQAERVVCKMREHFGSLEGRTIAVWGLAFKPRTDELRGAPAAAVVARLLEAGAVVRAYDPEAGKAAKEAFGSRVSLARRSYDALVGADALALLTEWPEFREPDFGKMRKLMRAPVIFDGRNVYRREQMRADGFTYYGIGR